MSSWLGTQLRMACQDRRGSCQSDELPPPHEHLPRKRTLLSIPVKHERGCYAIPVRQAVLLLPLPSLPAFLRAGCLLCDHVGGTALAFTSGPWAKWSLLLCVLSSGFGVGAGTNSSSPLGKKPRRKLHVRHETAGVHRAARRRGGLAAGCT